MIKFTITYSKKDFAWICDNDDYYYISDSKGGIPMPTYQPNKP